MGPATPTERTLTFASLPTETLLEVIRRLHPGDLPALSLVSRRLHTLTELYLYRFIHLKKWGTYSARRCFETLHTHKSAPLALRELHWQAPIPWPSRQPELAQALCRALRRSTGLRTLSITGCAVADRCIGRALLKSLKIDIWRDEPMHNRAPKFLPKLQTIEVVGDIVRLVRLAAHRPVTTVRVHNVDQRELHQMLPFLARSTGPVQRLDMTVTFSVTNAFVMLAQALPLVELAVGDVDSEDESEGSVEEILQALNRLPKPLTLQTLSLSIPVYSPILQHTIITRMHHACPTLRCIKLSSIQWKFQMGEWSPNVFNPYTHPWWYQWYGAAAQEQAYARWGPGAPKLSNHMRVQPQ